MVWQKGVIPFTGFFSIFIPSAVNYIVPAAIMYFAIPKENPEKSKETSNFEAWRCHNYILIFRYYNVNCDKSSKISFTNNFWYDNRTRCIKFIWFFSQKSSGPNNKKDPIKFDIFTQDGKS